MTNRRVCSAWIGIFLSTATLAAPVIDSKSPGQFDYNVPFGLLANDPAFVCDSDSVITLGPGFSRDFIHLSSKLLDLDVGLSGIARWGGGNWPVGTSGRIAVTYDFRITKQTIDEVVLPPPAPFVTESRTFPYECEAEEGCPAGEPDLGFGLLPPLREPTPSGFFPSNFLSAPGEEVRSALSCTEIDAEFPQHGAGEARVSGSFLIQQLYKPRNDKAFAEFLNETAGQFGNVLTIITLAQSGGSGAPIAEIRANALIELISLIGGKNIDNCLVSALTDVTKGFLQSRLAQIEAAASSAPGSKIIATAGIAANITSVVSQCLAADPPDLNVGTTFDVTELLSDVAAPVFLDTPEGRAIAAALDRDLRLSIAYSAALDAFERFQGAQILEDSEAYQRQIDNYFALMELTRSLAEESADFYASEAPALFDSAGILANLDLQPVVAALASIDEEVIATVLGPLDDDDLAALLASVEQLLEIASDPATLEDPMATVRSFGGLYDDLADYATTDAQTVVSEGIGSEFWESDEIAVAIDIRPYSSKNRVVPRFGIVPVAILGSTDFDALQVDIETVGFGPESAAPLVWPMLTHDVNRDAFPDLTLFFRSRSTGIQCGDTDAVLTGSTSTGDNFTASDSIQTIGCNHD